MLWKAQSRRNVELLEKQEHIESDLDEFRCTLTNVPEDLPWEMREILDSVPELDPAHEKRRSRRVSVDCSPDGYPWPCEPGGQGPEEREEACHG